MSADTDSKYNDECTELIEKLHARLVLLIVLDGERGTGFAAAARDPVIVPHVPQILRSVADQIAKGQ